MIGASLLARGLADADADAGKGIAVEVGLDGPQPVVAGQAAARLDLEPADRQVQLIVNDHQLGQVVDTDEPVVIARTGVTLEEEAPAEGAEGEAEGEAAASPGGRTSETAPTGEASSSSTGAEEG